MFLDYCPFRYFCQGSLLASVPASKWSEVSRKKCVFDCHSQLQNSHSQIFKLLKPLKISPIFIDRTIKHYREFWRVEVWAKSGYLKSVMAEAAIKTVREQICRKPLWREKIVSRKLNIWTTSSCAS
jgi:hypothetical protein